MTSGPDRGADRSGADLGPVLALDYGVERTGVAISDPTRTLGRPLDVVRRAGTSDGLATIATLVTELGVRHVIVGLPVSLGGSDSDQTRECRRFADRLRSRIAVPVSVHDERFTSLLADRVTSETGSSTSRDSLAACQLLTSYLEAEQ